MSEEMTSLTPAAYRRRWAGRYWTRRMVMADFGAFSGAGSHPWPYRGSFCYMSLGDRRRLFQMIPNPP